MHNLLTKSDRKKTSDLIIEKMREIFPVEINRQLVSEWAEENRTLTEGPFQGPFSFDMVPYLREIADVLSPSNTETREVAFMKPARIGATVSVGENWIGATIDSFPCDIGYITSDIAMAEIQMQTRIDALINESGLADKIGDVKIRSTQKKTMDKTVLKAFPGGTLLAGGPNSSFFKRSVGFKYLNVTEVDGFPDNIGKEGDPVGLFRRRCGSYQNDYKILWESSPKLLHNSKINKLYKQGDQRKYEVPCKKCGHKQFLKWGKKKEKGGLKFKHDDDDRLIAKYNKHGEIISSSVYYECEECGDHWKNTDKDYFLPLGEWKPTAKARRPGMKSYHLNALYAPIGFVSWETGIIEYLEIKHNGFPKLEFQVWINTFLGEPFEDRGERPRIELLLTRERTYKADTLPPDAKPFFITIGVDVHKDRVECEVVAWGINGESWSINYHVLHGDTSDLDAACWEGMRYLIKKEHAGMPVTLTGIDAGYRTDVVYNFCDTFEGGVHPVMGTENLNKGKDYIKLFNVPGHSHARIDINTDLLKQEIYRYLNKGQYESGDYPKGFCHFPVEYSREHFNRLTAETRVMETNSYGVKKYKWDAGQRRNEQLDCRVYALAMVYGYRLSIETELKTSEQIEEEYSLTWEDFWNYIAS